MANWNRFRFLPFATMAAVPLLLHCSSDITEAVCCKDFKPGSVMLDVDFGVDASIKGQYATFVQASADLSATATAMLADVEAACRGIALDLGAKADDPSVVGKTGTAGVSAWCALAVAQIKPLQASGKWTIEAVPPKCSASISAKAQCNAKCTVDGKCDIKATPPKCTGGKLEVACKGSCTAKAGATLSCTGKCEGTCKGSCTATAQAPSIECDGKCEGTCAAGGTAGGTGIQADGSCKGTCNGTCAARPGAVAVNCGGSCQGECSASCTGTAEASVKCDGECKADYEPLRCEGGKLEGGCQVDAQCDANCSASVNAKAECTPPEIRIVASGQISSNIAQALASLEKHIPQLLLVFQARGKAFLDLAVSFGGNADAVVSGTFSGKAGVKGTACGLLAVSAALQAADNAKAAIEGSGSVMGQFTVQ